MADSAADVDAHPHEGGGALETAKDLFSGAAGGVAQVLLGKLDPLHLAKRYPERNTSRPPGWEKLRGGS